MGKHAKRGAALRAKKRADETHQQLEQALTEQAERGRARSKKDEELFVIDTDRSETAASSRAAAARRAAAREKDALRRRKSEYSAREKRQIRRILENHGKDGAIALAESGRRRLGGGVALRKQMADAASRPTFDLWDESPLTKSTKAGEIDPAVGLMAQPDAKLLKRLTKLRKQVRASVPPQLAVEVAHPGQSYHPDREHHQDAIGEALSIEIRRNEAEEYKAKPVSEGMSDYTKKFIIESSEEDSSDEDEEECDGDNAARGTKIIKRKGKLTRAQRNKQKRVRAEQHELNKRRKRKDFLHQANNVHVHKRAIKRAEEEQLERSRELAQLKLEKKLKPLGKDVWNTLSSKDPLCAPFFPVALTEELQSEGDRNGRAGGLRTVTPKGSLVTDRLESMVARNMILKKSVKGRRIVQGKRRKPKSGKGMEYILI